MSLSPQIWQQLVDLVFQDNLIKHKQNFDVIMDDTFIHSTEDEHMDDLMDLFKVPRKYGLKISPHKGQFFKKNIVYMRLEFQVKDEKFFIHNLMNKVKRYIEACHTCLKTKPKYKKNRPVYGRIPVDYAPMQDLSIDIKTMPQAFGDIICY